MLHIQDRNTAPIPFRLKSEVEPAEEVHTSMNDELRVPSRAEDIHILSDLSLHISFMMLERILEFLTFIKPFLSTFKS